MNMYTGQRLRKQLVALRDYPDFVKSRTAISTKFLGIFGIFPRHFVIIFTYFTIFCGTSNNVLRNPKRLFEKAAVG
jgi:hypothetical protein